MSRLPITYGGVEYLDRTRALQDGSVAPEGVDWNHVAYRDFPGAGLFRRVARDAEFDAAELSLSTYVILLGRGDTRLIAIPVFPSRAFRHSQIYVHNGSGIERPEDLRGKKVGVGDYQTSALVWVRGMLRHDHGVAPEDIHWWTALRQHLERAPVELPPGVRLDRIPPDATIEGMVASGELDAMIGTSPPEAFERPNPTVRRLFADVRAVERDYFRRTGLFPIMHLVVVRRELYERHRWLANSLLRAFSASKALGRERLRYQGAYAVELPWLGLDIEETEAFFGGDPFPYGFRANRQTIDALTTYSFEQGLTARKLEPEELFAPETLSS